MYRHVVVFFLLLMLVGCGPKKLSPEDIARERKAVETAINDFFTAYQGKDLAGMKKLFSQSPDVFWFGTDSSEVIKGWSEWENQMNADWQLLESVTMGGVRNLAIQMDSDAQLASAVYEVPADVVIGGQPNHILFRFSGTLVKEEGKWKFIQGMVAVATTGQSSAEMLAKMNAEKAMKK